MSLRQAYGLGVLCGVLHFHLTVPFTKLAYLYNLTLHINHFLTEIRTAKCKSSQNAEIKMTFHHELIHITVFILQQWEFQEGFKNTIEEFMAHFFYRQ